MKPHRRNGAGYAGLKIGLLGGSFNPAHDGHMAMSLHALKVLDLDQVWWLVSPQNPLKSTQDMAGLNRRLSQAQKIAQHPRLIVTDIEVELGTLYTADTLHRLKQCFPHVQFVWLMGADNLRQIPRWRQWQQIFASVPVAVFRRPGYMAGRNLGKAAIRFGAAWQNSAKTKLLAALNANKRLPAWIILDNKLNYTSATQIRKDTNSWRH